jgi:peptide/nickel transport system substrate-binding protein
MRPAKLVLFVLSVAFLFMGSCKKESSKTGNTITVQLRVEPSTLSPFWGGDASRILLLHFTTHGLTMINPEDGQMVPVLADGLPEISSDGKEYIVTLDPKAAWSDGKLLTSQDVVFSMKASLAVEGPGVAMRDLYTSVKRVSALDERRIKVVFEEKNITNESLFAGIPITDSRVYDPDSLLSGLNVEELLLFARGEDALPDEGMAALKSWNVFLDTENFGQTVESTKGTLGPYNLVAWEPGSHMMFCPTKGFWASDSDKPWFAQKVDTLLFRFVNDPTALRLQIRQEAFDLALQIPGAAFNDSIKTPEYDYLAYNGNVFTFLAFNTRKSTGKAGILGNPAFRAAISHLIPVQAILDDYYQGRGVQVMSPVAPEKSSYNKELIADGYMPARAAEILKEAGFSDSDKDMVLDFKEDGKSSKASFELLYPSEVAPAEATALQLRDEARKIGIEIKAEPVAFRELFGRVLSRNYEAALLASSMSPYPYDFGQDFLATSKGNHTGFSTPELDSLIPLANQVLDIEERNKIMWQIQSTIHKEKPVIYLFNTTQPVAIHKSILNARVLPFSPYVWCNSLSRR